MARVGRLAGAILAESEGRYFLVGDLKEPCDFAAHGFEEPLDYQALNAKFIQLKSKHPPSLNSPILLFNEEGEQLANMLAHRFLIERNALVSERLWMLVVEYSRNENSTVHTQWLGAIPETVWQLVRETVLKCQ